MIYSKFYDIEVNAAKKRIEYLLDFLEDNNVEFWRMEPHDELTKVGGNARCRAFTIARPGVEYICYILGNGCEKLEMKLVKGNYKLRWYDPKTGKFLTSTENIRVKDRFNFVCPRYEQDVVLYVFADLKEKV